MNILFIDHDELWLNKMVEEIAGAIATSTMKPIGETHVIKTIVIDPEPQDTLKERTIAQMRALDFWAGLILVDLSFDNKNRDGSIQIGRRLAQGLREEFRELAVGVYSRFELSPRDKGLISSDRFALRLDEVRKMYEHLKDPMTGDDWNDVFEGVQRKSAEESSRLPLSFTTTAPENFIWADGHPYSRSTGFERVSRRLVANSLSFLELSEKTRVEISQLSGGFSGSFLVKAKIENGASFVVKIDEDPNKLKSELGGYRKVSARLDHKYYLQPFNAVTEPTTLLPDWWGAFALPCEVDAKTLLAEGPAAGSELAKLYRDLWNKCLFNLYGPTTVKKLGLKELFRKGTGKYIIDSWASIGRYAERFESCAPGALRQVQLLLEQFNLKDKEGWRSRKIATPWVEQVHGDLNCRNILYDAKNGSFFVIDFPHIEPNSLAYDFAKAEAELMLIMLDWGTGKDCDFDRILAWMKISSQLSGTFIPSSTSSTDIEINRAFEGAIAIRELYRSRAEKNGDVEVAYLTFLLSRLLRYLSYQDLTIAKRLFAFVWASQLAQALPIL